MEILEFNSSGEGDGVAGYILDTNIFNRIVEGTVSEGILPVGARFFATHIELDELKNTLDPCKRNRLLDRFRGLVNTHIPTESAVWDVSRFDAAKWRSGSGFYEVILEGLNEKNGGKGNNKCDALIAEAAICNDLTLITEDRHLLEVAGQHGASVCSLTDLSPA